MLIHRDYTSPVGKLQIIASPSGLRAVLWPKDARYEQKSKPGNSEILRQAARQLDEYFAGERRAFALPLEAEGTAFQRRAWRELERIPYGKTLTYGEQALRIGKPKAARAVGAANGRNPLSIVVPCHRVVGASGALTGFAGGIGAKRTLLEFEKKNL